jgi:hypothetical protein
LLTLIFSLSQIAEAQVFWDPDLFFYWIPLPDVLSQLLTDPSISEAMVWLPRPQMSGEGTRTWSHFCSGKFMAKAAETVPQGYRALHIGLGADATTIVKWGTRKFHPIYMWLPQCVKPMKQTLRLVGLFPQLKTKTISESYQPHLKAIIYHRCLEHLLAPIVQFQNRIKDLTLFNGAECRNNLFYPFISQFRGDIPEKYLSSGVYACCWKCLVTPELQFKFGRWPKHDYVKTFYDCVTGLLALAEGNTIKQATSQTTARNERLMLRAWDGLKVFDINRDSVSDIMHELPLGIGMHLWDRTFKWGRENIDDFERLINERYKLISTFSYSVMIPFLILVHFI